MKSLKDELILDKYSLDFDEERHAQLTWEWITEKLNQIKVINKLKEQLEVTKAEQKRIASNIFTKSKEDGKTDKLAEHSISNDAEYLIKQNEYFTKLREISEAEENLNYIEGALKALDIKKTSMQELTKLYCSGYYAKPNIPRQYKEAQAERREDEQMEGLNKSERLQRKRKQI